MADPKKRAAQRPRATGVPVPVSLKTTVTGPFTGTLTWRADGSAVLTGTMTIALNLTLPAPPAPAPTPTPTPTPTPVPTRIGANSKSPANTSARANIG